MEKVGRAAAIKRYIEDGTSEKVTTKEMMEFKKACTSEEWLQFAKDAAELIGVELQ